MNNNLTSAVKNAQNGDKDAWVSLFTMYNKSMYNVCIRLTGNRGDAEDVLQDSFMLAFNKIGSLKNPEAYGGWLKQIVVRECIRFCKKRILFEDLNQGDEFTIDDNSGWWLDVSLQDIHYAIKTLPEGCRLVFVLYVLENYSHKEVAHALEISEGTSKSQYYRAKTLLKEKIIKNLHINGQF
jgi:RNA polymerase sigma factor (sigma-70 family)